MSIKIYNLPRWLRDFVPLVLLMALIFALSSQPTFIRIKDEVGEILFYKSIHFGVYALLAWLWWRALSARRQIFWPLLLSAALLASLYGISDEYHQLFVPGRHGRVVDVLIDSAGALTMILLLRHFRWLRAFPERLPWPSSRQPHTAAPESETLSFSK